MTEPIWGTIRDSTTSARGVLRSVFNFAGQLEHIRTAHYAVFKHTSHAGNPQVLRLGAYNMSSYTGQMFEYDAANLWTRHNVPVVTPDLYVFKGNYDLMALPFLQHLPGGISTEVWGDALRSLRQVPFQTSMPEFTNREKTFARTHLLPTRDGYLLREEYDQRLSDLIDATTTYSWVHGDLHSENVIRHADGSISMYDLDTACWAPSVWDLTHLYKRAGVGTNTGYDPDQLASNLGVSAREFACANALRNVASKVAQLVREL